MMRIVEDAFYFENGGKRLFGVLHSPASAGADAVSLGLVTCAPFGDEHIASYRTLRDAAVELAEQGIAVLRFDYAGYGDSEGSFEDATLESQAADTRRALAVLQERSGAAKVGLLGLRLGSAVALRTAADNPLVQFVLLWAPVLSGSDFFRQILRKQALSEMMYGDERISARQLTDELARAGRIDIGGYYLSAATHAGFCEIDCVARLNELHVPASVLLADREFTEHHEKSLSRLRRDLPPSGCAEFIPTQPFWRFPDEGSLPPTPSELIRRSAAWLVGLREENTQ